MSEIHPNHKRQIDEGIRTSLLRAGIPSELLKQSVTQLPKGDALVEAIKGEFKELIKGGKTLAITGEGSSVHDTAYLISRGLHLSGVGCLVVSLSQLASIASGAVDDGDMLERIVFAPCLTVMRFYVPDGPDDQPMTSRTKMMVEDLLLERSGQGRGHIVQCDRLPEVGTEPRWWRKDFLRNFFRGCDEWRVDQ